PAASVPPSFPLLLMESCPAPPAPMWLVSELFCHPLRWFFHDQALSGLAVCRSRAAAPLTWPRLMPPLERQRCTPTAPGPGPSSVRVATAYDRPGRGRRMMVAMKASRAAARRPLPGSPFNAPAPAPPAETFAVHDQVTHDRNGPGVVLSVEHHAVLVAFRPAQRRIPLPCAKLTKL